MMTHYKNAYQITFECSNRLSCIIIVKTNILKAMQEENKEEKQKKI